MILERILPIGEPTDGAAVLHELRSRIGLAAPFNEPTCSLLCEFSRGLRRHAFSKLYPELQALAFWTRPALITRLKTEWERLAESANILVPRGLAFHIPPANVDTVFVYSWALSALTGNVNVIRLPSVPTDQVRVIGEVLGPLFDREEYRQVREAVAMVRYDHDSDVTAMLSGAADVRVIWGGDETVSRIRGIPLPPSAVELTFPDRFSLAAFDARAVMALPDIGLKQLARDFYNDVFSFNQLGCSSPRLVVWRGDDTTYRAARDRLYCALIDVCQARGYAVPTSAVLAKLGYAFDLAAEGHVVEIRRPANEVTIVELLDLATVDRSSPGAGLLLEVRVEDLLELAPFVQRKDQTLCHFGFARAQVRSLAAAVNGRGIDRMVPVGKALAFGRYWDGYDLLQAFSRRVLIQ